MGKAVLRVTGVGQIPLIGVVRGLARKGQVPLQLAEAVAGFFQVGHSLGKAEAQLSLAIGGVGEERCARDRRDTDTLEDGLGCGLRVGVSACAEIRHHIESALWNVGFESDGLQCVSQHVTLGLIVGLHLFVVRFVQIESSQQAVLHGRRRTDVPEIVDHKHLVDHSRRADGVPDAPSGDRIGL